MSDGWLEGVLITGSGERHEADGRDKGITQTSRAGKV